MSFFKKRGIAFLLTVCVVIAATLVSVNVKLSKKCQSVTDGFYDGVEFNGYTQKSIASHLKNITAYADGLVTIANNYDIDTADVENASDLLKSALAYSQQNRISNLYREYQSLLKAVNAMEDQLARADLDARDASGVEQYISSITGAQSAIESAGYNESVREFMRSYDRFPTNILGTLAGVEMPECFE